MKASHYNNTHILAEHYIAADKSDPFTRNRVYSHIANGLCDDAVRGSKLEDSRYKAVVHFETRKPPPSPEHPNGQEYQAEAYHSISRP